MIHVRIPATTANMGSGFDSIGMALQLYNHLWVEESGQKLIIEEKNGSGKVPLDETNLIYRSMLRFYAETGFKKEFDGIKMIQEDHIPFTRGLGSSAACVVGGLLAANELSRTKLSVKEIAELAAIIEGHPDNATPAVLGGMVVGAMENGKLTYVKLDLRPLLEKGIKFGAIIPNFPLSTEKARGVLPEVYSRSDVVFNVSRAALMVAAVMTADPSKLMVAMDDKIHQPYRQDIIPNMEDIFAEARILGAHGVFLSGAGPTILTVYDGGKVKNGMEQMLAALPDQWSFNELAPDMDGAWVERIN